MPKKSKPAELRPTCHSRKEHNRMGPHYHDAVSGYFALVAAPDSEAAEILKERDGLLVSIRLLKEALMLTPHRLGDIACGRGWSCACKSCAASRSAIEFADKAVKATGEGE